MRTVVMKYGDRRRQETFSFLSTPTKRHRISHLITVHVCLNKWGASGEWDRYFPWILQILHCIASIDCTSIHDGSSKALSEWSKQTNNHNTTKAYPKEYHNIFLLKLLLVPTFVLFFLPSLAVYIIYDPHIEDRIHESLHICVLGVQSEAKIGR
jgi:hypothetical protein